MAENVLASHGKGTFSNAQKKKRASNDKYMLFEIEESTIEFAACSEEGVVFDRGQVNRLYWAKINKRGHVL